MTPVELIAAFAGVFMVGFILGAWLIQPAMRDVKPFPRPRLLPLAETDADGWTFAEVAL